MRVRGDSLDNLGLKSGDLVVVRRETHPRNGDLVVTRTGRNITVGRFRRLSAGVAELRPESSNPVHRTIQIDTGAKDVEIIGVAVGAIMRIQRARQRERDVGLEM